MATQRYTVTPHPIETLLTWVKTDEIAIAEIQRPFVWEATKVRNLLDSLYRGYNQIANYVLAQSEINIAIGDRSPATYFPELAAQCAGGPRRYGGITTRADLEKNFAENCLPPSLLDGTAPDYDAFLDQRRRLMAAKIKTYFQTL